MTTVMLVDDQEMIRKGLRVIIDAYPGLDVVAEAGDGFTAVRRLDSVQVDVILMDLNMPGMDGVEAVRRIREARGPEGPRILVLTTFDQDENVLAAMRAGANGFLGKGAGPDELAEGIRRVAAGAHALSDNAIGALVSHVSDPHAVPPDPDKAKLFEGLTPRELEVVRLVVEGLDNAEIGRRVFISPFTAKTHVDRAMAKVGARDRAQLVSLAVQAGIRP
ncbi:response regulator [Propionibacterium freudenreichii]|jgi:DNA-binding NarL/FixJ family response regulator|uniref:response regulator n=1 Tax=Propionibacterium freudenreichii TaxID=1744 RepID=UPI000543AB10|nr:response regulator transcription factor [Propionibacterium freudenreichii]CEG93002.1 Two-component system, regulatory protein [Propionibacterium freudenreichii]